MPKYSYENLGDIDNLEDTKCCDMSIKDLRGIFWLAIISEKSLNERYEIWGERRTIGLWLIKIWREVEYNFKKWKKGRIAITEWDIFSIMDVVLAKLGEDLILKFLKSISKDIDEMWKEKLAMLKCMLNACNQARDAFWRFGEVVEEISENPDIIRDWIANPLKNPLNDILKIWRKQYNIAEWFLFLLHLAGFETDLSSLWETIKNSGEEAIKRLNKIFEEIYGDGVSGVKEETAAKIKETLTDGWSAKTEKSKTSRTWSKKRKEVPLPRLVTPLIGPDPMLHVEEISNEWMELLVADSDGGKIEKFPVDELGAGAVLIKKVAWFLPWNVKEGGDESWLLKWVKGRGDINKRLIKQMLEADYAKINIGVEGKWKFVWEEYLEDVERYFNFASGWNEFLGEMMEWLTLWRRYLVFVNLYLIWVLWGQISPSQMDSKTKGRVIAFLKTWLSLRAWEIIVALRWLWFEPEEIKEIMQRGYPIIKPSGENVKGTYDFLKAELWEDVAKEVVKKFFNLLGFSKKILEEKMKFWKEKLWEEWAKKAVREYPNLLGFSKKILEEKMKFWKEKLWEEWAKKAVREYPNLLGLSKETLRGKMELLEEMLWGEWAKRAVRGQPNLLGFSKETLRKRMKFLEEKLWKEWAKEAVKKIPGLLARSEKTLRKRMKFLEKILWEEEAKRFVNKYPLLLKIISIEMLESCKEKENPEKCLKEIVYSIIVWKK